MLESVAHRPHLLFAVLGHAKVGPGNVSLWRDTVCAIARQGVSGHAAVNDTLAKQTGDIRDTWEGQCSPGRSARRASEEPPEVKIKVSITTNPARLTALQVACSVHALPGPCTPSKHAACGPAMPHLRARAAANPAPLRGGLAEGGTRCRQRRSCRRRSRSARHRHSRLGYSGERQ